jgi:hypothetical protein
MADETIKQTNVPKVLVNLIDNIYTFQLIGLILILLFQNKDIPQGSSSYSDRLRKEKEKAGMPIDIYY